MGEESIPRPVINGGAQGTGNGLKSATQSLLFGLLGLIVDSQLLCVPIAGAYKCRSDTLTTGLSLKITLLPISRSRHPMSKIDLNLTRSFLFRHCRQALEGLPRYTIAFATPPYSTI